MEHKIFRITPSAPEELGGRALLHMSTKNRDGELQTRRQALRRRIRSAVDREVN